MRKEIRKLVENEVNGRRVKRKLRMNE